MKKSFTLITFMAVLALAFTWHAAGGIGRGVGGAVSGSSGDTNGDGTVDIADAIHILRYLFIDASKPPVSCMAQIGGTAQEISFDPAGTTLSALNVQSAIHELDQKIQALSRNSSIDMELVPIPTGNFLMGSPITERNRGSNETLHRVEITKNIKMGAKEVTQAQYRALIGWNPSAFAGCPDCPVEGVNWYEAMDFCRQLTARHRLEGKIGSNDFYRLPTESEWEYACRAGTTTSFHFGDVLNCQDGCESCTLANEYLWYCGNSSPTSPDAGTKPVGRKQPNPWGLHDMQGNVWEWCLDFFGDYPQGTSIDPQGPLEGTNRVVRGGKWLSRLLECRSAGVREGLPPLSRADPGALGFRVVLELGQ